MPGPGKKKKNKVSAYKKAKLDMKNNVAKMPDIYKSSKKASIPQKAQRAQAVSQYKKKGAAAVKKQGYKRSYSKGGLIQFD